MRLKIKRIYSLCRYSLYYNHNKQNLMLAPICIKMIAIILILGYSNCYNIKIINSTNEINVTNPDGVFNNDFIASRQPLACIMPKIFIYNDTSHANYSIQSQGAVIQSITGNYRTVQSEITCQGSTPITCLASVNNGCQGTGKNQMNWIKVALNNGNTFQYLVNCNPDQYYKPFQWGLFILIFFCTVTITMSSLYSRAWSYKGYGINVNKKFIVAFNAIIIFASIMAYYIPKLTALWLKVVGSGIGIVGVTVCTSQTLWLLKSRRLNEHRVSFIRLLDVISFFVGVLMTAIYWLTNGAWIVNDILAVCTMIAGIKLLKIRSLSTGIFMLYSLLIIEITAGLIVHYALKMSYNNLVIQIFQSPLVVVFPSITPQLFRKCAWIPVSNLLFPGLFISYLRRFDKSRGTFLYLLIGYGSFYLGSILWMVVDMSIRHSLPMAIISDPITTIAVFGFAWRRNELKTIWNGLFYDTQLPDMSEDMLPTRSSDYIVFQDMTQNLKIDKNRRTSEISQGQI